MPRSDDEIALERDAREFEENRRRGCIRDTEADDGSCRCEACQERAIDQAHGGAPQDEGDPSNS
jgi:hypothetical protein